MKYLLCFSIFTFCLSSFASEKSIFFTEGSLKGKPVLSTGSLSYEPACYLGNAWKAKNSLLKMANEDGEKINNSVWYNKKSKNLEFSFVDTKCLDDSLDATEGECTVDIIIVKCK